MAIPVMDYIHSSVPSTSVEKYSYYGERIEFIGSRAFVGFGNDMHPVKWTVFQVNSPQVTPFSSTGNVSNPLSIEHFTTYETKRITNLYQNSAVMIMGNGNVTIAEIYSFMTTGIDATLVVKNTNITGNFIGAFSIGTNHHSPSMLDGTNSQIGYLSSGTGIISGNYYNATAGNVSVNWQSDSSIFKVGMITPTSNGDEITLPFNVGTLYNNESYTIDPMIYRPIFPILPIVHHPKPVPVPLKYAITFTESGLSSETTWSVTLDGSTQTSTSSSIIFYEYDGTYSYSIGSINQYSISPSGGSVSVSDGSKTVNIGFNYNGPRPPALNNLQVFYSQMGCPNENLTVHSEKYYNSGLKYESYLQLAYHASMVISIRYTNATGSTGSIEPWLPNTFGGIWVYAINSNNQTNLFSPLARVTPVGDGTISIPWAAVPGAYDGFAIYFVNQYGEVVTNYYHTFDVYSQLLDNKTVTTNSVINPTTCPYLYDSYATTNVYNTQGNYVGSMGLVASGGPTAIGNHRPICLQLVFYSPYDNFTGNYFKYGIFNYSQSFSYTGSQVNGNNQCAFIYATSASSQGTVPSGSSTSTQLQSATEKSIYDVIAAGFLASEGGTAVGFSMLALEPFIFNQWGSYDSKSKSHIIGQNRNTALGQNYFRYISL
ncbi:MAG: hypothetical protein ACYDAO_08470 [Thermoplasmataceae archaeon]